MSKKITDRRSTTEIDKNTKDSKNIESITIRLRPYEKAVIKDKAAQARKSVNQYVIDTVLNSGESYSQKEFELGRRLVQLSRAADHIQSDIERQIAKEEVTKLWRNSR